MKDVFIVNPKSGKNSQYELIQEIKEHFQGKRIIIEKTKGPEHATFIAKKYALSQKSMLYPMNLYICMYVAGMVLCMKLLMGVPKKKM